MWFVVVVVCLFVCLLFRYAVVFAVLLLLFSFFPFSDLFVFISFTLFSFNQKCGL